MISKIFLPEMSRCFSKITSFIQLGLTIKIMNDNSVISLQIHSYTFIAYYMRGTMRISLEINHNEEVIYQSAKFTPEYFPAQLQILFESVAGLYEYIYKLAAKNMTERLQFRNGLLKIKVFVDDKMKQIPIKMKKMVEEKEVKADNHPFLLTSISSEAEEDKKSKSRVSTNFLEKIEKDNYSGPRLKLMMLRQNNKMKKAMTKVPELNSSSVTQNLKEYPYLKPQFLNRYDKYKTQENASAGRKSRSQGKTMYNHHKSLNLRKSMKDNNLDLSNKDLKISDIKDIISYDWTKLVLLNLGYNNIGTEGLRLLTSVRWPALKTLYVCFNNIYKIEWTPANVCFLKTLSLSGNKIKQIPKNIIELQFLQQLFIYNNKIQLLPEELSLMQQMKNLSIYGNKIDFSKNKVILARLKSRKVQIWQ